MSINPIILAAGFGLEGEERAAYAAERAAATDAQARAPLPGPDDAAVVAFVRVHPGLREPQLAAGLNTMDTKALRLQLRRLGRATPRRAALLECVGGKWFVREGK